ncbi:hypothetical protein HPB50_005768 [Hyalomma asiaticum]|uniref:Uncharacterized protein n=1 Tax=Hyalomma asiaticum TaxID=266040 RepID=A0ACB7SEV5_HYAAI|nr:hypothetical protein HPB50_005768 [Hyalomma asiaticum]
MEWYRHNGKNAHATARHFSLDKKRTREWEKQYETLLQQNFGKAKLRRKLSNGAPVFSEEVDDAPFEFLGRERSAGRARWKQRFGITMCHATNESQKTPEDFKEEAAKAFRSAVNALRVRHDYTFFNISNMDQSMVRMDSPANRTNNVVGESTVRIANTGCAHGGFTVALAACATNVRVTASKNGWMTSDKMQEWLSRV